MADNNKSKAADPFGEFWGDMFARMGAAMPGADSSSSQVAAKQAQRTFFDALAKYCDDYMRSKPFLEMMRRSMDQSLQFKQQVDQFLTQLHRGAQSPAKDDVDDLSGLLRSIEQRVLSRLDALERKVAAVEGRRAAASGAKAGASRRRASRGAGRGPSKNKARGGR